MNLRSKTIYFILGLFFGISISFFLYKRHENNWENRKKELTLKVDSLRNSNQKLLERISQRDSTLNKINVNYEEERINLSNQSVYDDFEFFSNYLER